MTQPDLTSNKTFAEEFNTTRSLSKVFVRAGVFVISVVVLLYILNHFKSDKSRLAEFVAKQKAVGIETKPVSTLPVTSTEFDRVYKNVVEEVKKLPQTPVPSSALHTTPAALNKKIVSNQLQPAQQYSAPAGDSIAPLVITNVISTSTRELTYNEMEEVLDRLRSRELVSDEYNKSVQVRKTSTSNVANAFELASFLRSKGYVILGRQITPVENDGIEITSEKHYQVISIGKL